MLVVPAGWKVTVRSMRQQHVEHVQLWPPARMDCLQKRRDLISRVAPIALPRGQTQQACCLDVREDAPEPCAKRRRGFRADIRRTEASNRLERMNAIAPPEQGKQIVRMVGGYGQLVGVPTLAAQDRRHRPVGDVVQGRRVAIPRRGGSEGGEVRVADSVDAVVLGYERALCELV